ncbi:MAG: UDP-glucose/GDP-mannose dehydrogenase family protein [Rickettsiales bacterium]|nr:UDP-glucose/GDP-mannose dehydrogenase family protein [Rickettsiales bacterium]
MNSASLKITVIGTGYVGLVTGCCLAEIGHQVTCIDTDKEKIAQLQQGVPTIYEDGMEALLKRNIERDTLRFSSHMKNSIPNAEVVFLCVGTPPRKDGGADLSYIINAAEEVAKHLSGYTVIVNKSTVPPRTALLLERKIYAAKGDIDVDVVSNPEFLREGSAIKDFMRAERIVVGSDSQQAMQTMKWVYESLIGNHVPFVETDTVSAELIKYAANGLLATKICFANELADLSEKLGGNMDDIKQGIGLDSRIGQQFLNPGPGFGGACFPKDAKALVHIGNHFCAPMTVMQSVLVSNEARHERIMRRIRKLTGGLAGQHIAVLGLAFKAGTDDMRESPAAELVRALHQEKVNVIVYDPQAMDGEKAQLPDSVHCAESAYSAVEGADMVIIATEWSEFIELDLDKIEIAMRQPLMLDLRNIYDLQKMKESNIIYHSLGRPSVNEDRQAEVISFVNKAPIQGAAGTFLAMLLVILASEWFYI